MKRRIISMAVALWVGLGILPSFPVYAIPVPNNYYVYNQLSPYQRIPDESTGTPRKLKDYGRTESADPGVLFATEPVSDEEVPKDIYHSYDTSAGTLVKTMRLGDKISLELYDGTTVYPIREVDPDTDEERILFSIPDPLAHRYLKKSMTLSTDQKVVYFNQLNIPVDTTLTIERGVTLTVEGEIIIEGTLVNNGTLVIAKRSDPKESDYKEYAQSFLLNKGVFQNNGTLKLTQGYLDNRGAAENTGAIDVTISSSVKGLTAITNTCIKDKVTASFSNKGQITLQHSGAAALINDSGAKFENTGTITKVGETSIKGKITGNAPTSSN